ncbi:MAG TPA: M24 family metallopeptidase, partial [Verrucomicrobiae bacterium]|nr:M24 family metallopeptidase [Verrucomicrobiae bacterium]
NSPIQESDVIVLDVGAEVQHYAADIARTISQAPITGRTSDVWRAVADTQDYAFSLIKPGVMPYEYETAVEQFIGEKLLELGILKTITRDGIRRYFPHATSHFLGLDTHDTGNYRAPWQAGMVIAVEPGIYLPDENIGVRLEDDVLITETGYELLSNACPRELTTVQ